MGYIWIYQALQTYVYLTKPHITWVFPMAVAIQEYDLRHIALEPSSSALRPRLATKAALKCLQRAEGGGWRLEDHPGMFDGGYVYIYSVVF